MADEMIVDVWLYGPLAQYGGEGAGPGYANCRMTLPAGAVMQNLLVKLGIPAAERGITFINGNLSAMPGLQPDLDQPLVDGDRVAMFHLKSMWPFQYRHGVAMTRRMTEAMHESPDAGLHHAYTRED